MSCHPVFRCSGHSHTGDVLGLTNLLIKNITLEYIGESILPLQNRLDEIDIELNRLDEIDGEIARLDTEIGRVPLVDGKIPDTKVSTSDGSTQNLKNTKFSSDIAKQKLDTGITATAKFGGVERTLASKNADTVNIRDFIDPLELTDAETGIKDVYQNIVNASKYASDNNKTLIFNNGKTYKSTQNFSFNYRINWAASADSPDKPVIKITQETGIGVKVYGVKQADLNLASDINLWDSIVNVNNTVGVQKGQLLSVLSDTKWVGVSSSYSDTIKKGHLCLVDEVISTTKIRLAEPINTRYLDATENVRLELHNPINKPSINGIEIEKPTTNINAVGFEYEYCTDISVKNSRFTGAQGYGFQADRCYGGEVSNCFGRDAVKLYQFSCAGSANLVYDKLTATRCAKTFDATGFSIPSRNITVSNSIDNHGGVDASGNSMHKQGTGFGTHWGTENVTFINCKTRNRYRGFYQRGLGDQYINCKAEGTFALSPFQLENPRNVSVLSCEYDSNIVTSKRDIDSNAKPITAADYDTLPKSFCTVMNTDGTNKTGQFSIKGCRANGIGKRLVNLFGDNIEFNDFEVTDNTFFVANTASANDICEVETVEAGSKINNFVIDRNILQTNSGQTHVYKLGTNASLAVKNNLVSASIVGGSKAYVMTLDTDTAGIIHAGTRNDGIEISIRVDSKAGYFGKGVLYKDGTFDSFAQSKLYTRAAFLSGTTGTTASVDTIGIATNGSRLYVQNRTGERATIIITVSSPI